jgi:hypothetical protein
LDTLKRDQEDHSVEVWQRLKKRKEAVQWKVQENIPPAGNKEHRTGEENGRSNLLRNKPGQCVT